MSFGLAANNEVGPIFEADTLYDEKAQSLSDAGGG
jgi:hypothetical protein